MAKIRATWLAQVSALTAGAQAIAELALRARFDSSPMTWERVGYGARESARQGRGDCPGSGHPILQSVKALTLGGPNKQKIGRTVGQALGWGVPVRLLAVNVALPDRQVVALQGDGGFLFTFGRGGSQFLQSPRPKT